MFTIRHISDNFEQLFQAKSVCLVPNDPSRDYPARHLRCASEGNEELYFQTGTVYVMNENGKTVGKYYFE
jgi:hypothetical protein